ncbi:MAG TPA: hypothetical protein PK720_01335 [bacterium]|nr:hypothetical protein [bacterium]
MKKTFFFKINDFSLPALGLVVLSLVALWVLKFVLASQPLTAENDNSTYYYVVTLGFILIAMLFLYLLAKQELGLKQGICFGGSLGLIALNFIIEGSVAGENIYKYYILILLLSGQFILSVICFFTYLLPLDSFVLIVPRDKNIESKN